MAWLSTSSIKSDDQTFSFKRYFINNLDSYHGEYILKEVLTIVDDKNQASVKQSKQSLHTLLGEDGQAAAPSPPPEPIYEIIGTVSDAKVKSIDGVAKIVSKNDCVPHMLKCGTVILDISYDREELRIAMEYLKVLKALLEKQKPAEPINNDDETDATGGGGGDSKRRFLILISTIMTWAATKPLDPDLPELPFVETDFRKRKPHPNYVLHKDAENETIAIARKYRPLIGALVVATGLTYGGREDVLYYWFQKAWECEPILPILGRGSNPIPLINVADLAKIVYNLISEFPRRLYILAVEQNITKQREIVKPLGRSVGSGMFKCIPSEDAFLIPEIDQRIFDLMTVKLNMEPNYVVERMALQYTSDLPFADNTSNLMKQFKKERGLKPFKILIYGPPIVGKTTLAKRIAQQYGLMYISPDTVTQDLMEYLAARIIHLETGETALLPLPTGEEEDVVMDDEDTGDEEGLLNSLRQQYSLLQATRQYTEEETIGHLRQRLLIHEAVNRGWVLDGYPTTLSQCSSLFEKGDEQDAESESGDQPEPFDEDIDLYSNVLKKLLPDLVVSLNATDDFICEKAMRLPEGDPRFEEETILKRLNDFRSADSRDISPLNFFDELDIHPFVVNVTMHNDYVMDQPYNNVTLRMGRPCRYGKLTELTEAAEKKERQLRELAKSEEAASLEKMRRKLQEEREEKMEYWTELYALLREEEEAALAAAGEPMRNYLVQNIFPTLTPALLEIAKLRPADPIDFLAEELFKLNPTGKMLEPGYNFQAEKLLGRIKILDDAILDLDIQIDPLYDTTQEDNLFPKPEPVPSCKIMAPL